MSTKIKGAEYPLAKIFSSDFDYEIPRSNVLMHGPRKKLEICSTISMISI